MQNSQNNEDSKKNNRDKKDYAPVFETLAILDETYSTPITNIAIPSDEAVEDAKNWVDHNEK